MKKEKKAKERKPNWKEYMASVEDIQNFLMDRILLRHNVITRRVEYRFPAEFRGETTEWEPLSDRIINSLWTELSATKVVRAQSVCFCCSSERFLVFFSSGIVTTSKGI